LDRRKDCNPLNKLNRSVLYLPREGFCIASSSSVYENEHEHGKLFE